MTPDDVLRLRVSDVIATYQERDRFRSALEEIANLPDSDYQDDGKTHRDIAVKALSNFPR